MKKQLIAAVLALSAGTAFSALPDGSLAWSDPASWGGSIPTIGTSVTIPPGKVITLDVSPPVLGNLTIGGTLRFARTNLNLTAAGIKIPSTGKLQIGTATEPFTHKATITLNGVPQTTNDGVSRGLLVMGGALQLYGTAPIPTYTKLTEHAWVGTTALVTKDNTNWKTGDSIAVGPTDYYIYGGTEEKVLNQNAFSNRIGISPGIERYKWGKLQYVTGTGISLIPDPNLQKPTDNPVEIDQRALVANLTRNIVIQGANDSAWTNQGFGAHIMIMGLNSIVKVYATEIRNAGQAGTLARYPFHWHMLSHTMHGDYLGDTVGHYFMNNVVRDSSQRCIVVHATNGVRVQNNICYNIKGHAIFLENAVEQRNHFEDNVVLKVRLPIAGKELLKHDNKPSGYWITNPDNVFANNYAADTLGNGFWLAFPPIPLNDHKTLAMVPNTIPLKYFERNYVIAAYAEGIQLRSPAIDDLGNTALIRYTPKDSAGNNQHVFLRKIQVYKSGDSNGGAYGNHTQFTNYRSWVVSDNYGTNFSGSSDNGVISGGLLVGTSLNNLNPYPTYWAKLAQTAVASYHHSIDFKDNLVVNFPFVAGKNSGMIGTSDNYIEPVTKGQARNSGNKLINSSFGTLIQPGFRTGETYALAGAKWDPYGHVGVTGRFWVYDEPFFTTGATCTFVEPAGQNGKSCSGQFYGVNSFTADFDPNRWSFRSPIVAYRLGASGYVIGTWGVMPCGGPPCAPTDRLLGGMRHFAAKNTGRYVLEFPGNMPTSWIDMTIANVYRPTDWFILAVPFDGTKNIDGYMTSWFGREAPRKDIVFWKNPDPSYQGYTRWLKLGNSYAEMSNSAGDIMWQDRTNNLVWVKIVGGLRWDVEANLQWFAADSDQMLNRDHHLSIFEKVN